MPEIPNLWPEFVEPEILTPLSILKAQAASLGAQTSHLLEGETTSRSTSRGGFEHKFYIYAPTLDYRLEILRIDHPLDFYPMKGSAWGGEFLDINDEQQFLQWIKNVFSSERTRKAIQSLLAQTKSA
ncbi:MAG TPA: hypothetical protein VG759_12135 [Candidatus Angelobacter sp.]|jgi:hypothetical protein|nr:hypothetical protein [Candidatus Angelobacter sp.]